jgi:hypothetical protein
MPKNIVIFSDGTGQAGGVNFDEVRTNVYKLYRACRVGPDTLIDPFRAGRFLRPGPRLSRGRRSLPGQLAAHLLQPREHGHWPRYHREYH